MLKLVPFNDRWVTHDKLDLHAIYRRPQRKEDEYGDLKQVTDAQGVPLWDITTPLPVRQHNKWRAKGFEYVTLADRSSLMEAAKHGTLLGDDPWQAYVQNPRDGGPWHEKKYRDGANSADADALAHLKADVERFGSEAVEAIRRQTDPGFTLPEALRGVAPGGVSTAAAPTTGLGSTPGAPTAKKPAAKKTAATAGDPELVGGFPG